MLIGRRYRLFGSDFFTPGYRARRAVTARTILLKRKVGRGERFQSLAQPVRIDPKKRAYRFETKQMGRAARMKPDMRIEKFRPLARGTTVLGAHVAAQRILENREEELELAARRTSSRHP